MLEEKLHELISKEQDVIPFLKSLTPTEKKSLVPAINKFKEKFYEQKHIEKKQKGFISYTSEYIHTEKKRDLIDKVCFNKAAIKKAYWNISQKSITDEYLTEIIPWFVPKWFSDLINESPPSGLNYLKMMQLEKQGLLEISDNLLRVQLAMAVVETRRTKTVTKSYYVPENLLVYKETLESHIWKLFEEECGINNYYAYLHLENYKEGNDVWITTLKNFSDEKRISREQLLIKTLHTSTKGFNKTLSGWFFDLLVALNPTKDEVLLHQKDFFVALQSPHSKVINTVLKYFKTVVIDKKFDAGTFIDNSSILLNSEVKAVVISTLMMLEKIAKSNKKLIVASCAATTEALLNQDEKIQLRAAKILAKYGDTNNEDFISDIAQYTSNLFFEPKQMLSHFLDGENQEEEEQSFVFSEKAELVEVKKYNTFDELLFFISQVLDNNEVYHLDMLVTLLPKLNVLITSENVIRLEPILKRAIDLSLNLDNWNSQIGNLEQEAASYLNDYGMHITRKFPKQLTAYNTYKKNKIKNIAEHHTDWLRESIKPIEKQFIPDYCYQPYRTLLIKSKELISKNSVLPLLSTPTHEPCWVNPTVLINRINAYSKQDVIIMNYSDLQLALGRLDLTIDGKTIADQITTINIPEYEAVINYLYELVPFNINYISKADYGLWLVAVLIKRNKKDIALFKEVTGEDFNKEMALYNWECKERHHSYKKYDYVKKKNVMEHYTKQQLLLTENKSLKKEDTFLSSIKSVFTKNKEPIYSYFQFIKFKKEKYYTTIRPNDDVKFLMLSPNHPEVFLAEVINTSLKESTFYDESSKKNMVNILKGLYQVWNRQHHGEMTYLFLATGLLCSDKVARELAAELWIKTTAEGKMDQMILGATLGKLQHGSYAPMKRFTDLLTERIFNIGTLHNEELFMLLTEMILKLNNEPIRGLKKLLEMYLELHRNHKPETMENELQLKIAKWSQTKSLQLLLKKLK